jgi:hypothetical protein
MHLTQVVASRFVFGQVETRKKGRQYILRGDIEIIVTNQGTLDIVCHWVAIKDTSNHSPHSWVLCKLRNFSYQIDQYRYDEDELKETGVLRLTNPNDPYEDEILLYTPDGSRLDPQHVEGIEPIELIHP